tara:strand:+ start:9703 stop:10092 length:390 start_codon:yes stop_codon:yes gene_type:complete
MNIDIKNTKPYNEIIEYTDIIKCVEEREEKNNINKEHSIFDYDNEDYLNNFFLLQQDYMDNYRRKDLDRIADYYDISKRKKRKEELVQDIIVFEQDVFNEEIVEHRKLLWYYLQELMNDNYLKKYIILD